jgi:pimeloyl-ACP methyl ester carboxylesterase
MTVLDHTREGRGSPTIVFVHGFACARSDWRHQVAHLRGRYETVAVDIGGHGTTPGTEAHERIETHGQDVANLLAELNIERAVLVGHSMGCRIVADAATKASSRIVGIIQVDGSRLGTAGSTTYVERQKRIAEIGYRAFMEPFFAQMFLPGADRAISQPIVDRALAMPAKLAGNLFPNIGHWDSEHFDTVLSSLRAPLMAIQSTSTNPAGQRTPMTKGQTTAYLDNVKSLVPHARIEVIPDVGHFPQIEKAGEVNALIDDFLARLKA